MALVDDLCRSYLDLKWHFNPADGSLAGAVAHDGRLGTFDAESMRAHLAAFRSLAGAAEELDTDSLQEEIDRTALLDDMRTLLFRFEYEKPHVRNPSFWLTHLFEGVYALMSRRGGRDGRDGRELGVWAPAMLERLKAAPKFLDQGRATLKAPPAVFVDAALGALGGGGELIAQAAGVFGAAAPELAEELTEAARGALEALTRYGRALGSEILPSDDPNSFAVGEEQFARRLHHEHALRGGAGELWRYGMHLVEETKEAVAAAAREVDPARPWREVVERLMGDAPAGDVLAAYRDEVERARGFLEETGVAPLPTVPLDVVPTPSFLASLVPFAAYAQPPVELGGPGLFYVTVPNGAPVTAKVSPHCVHQIPSLAAHEALPGHHLQMTSAQGLPSEVRRHLWTPVTVEGWALYGESLMYEGGFFRTPEARLFHLVSLLWRAARIVLDVGLHTRGLTPAEAVDELIASMPMERRSAEAEVRRYCAMPTYQLSYAIGRREILLLRESYRARAGSGYSARAFHADLLSYGGLPISLARWGMGLDDE